MMNMSNLKRQLNSWPKVLPKLSVEQEAAREKFMQLWHEILPKKYGRIEEFNHGYVARLLHEQGSKTLEIGAGLGEHAKFEELRTQDYYCLEYRESFCEQLRNKMPKNRVFCGDIQKRQAWSDGFFDRVIAIHVLEHLPDLPKALEEICRLLKDGGVFDVVIPCEGSLLYSLARKVSAERVFVKNFKMDYLPIILNEHVNTYSEIHRLLVQGFSVQKSEFFPFRVPIADMNLVVGLRLIKNEK